MRAYRKVAGTGSNRTAENMRSAHALICGDPQNFSGTGRSEGVYSRENASQQAKAYGGRRRRQALQRRRGVEGAQSAEVSRACPPHALMSIWIGAAHR
jgi:hypothetical protein